MTPEAWQSLTKRVQDLEEHMRKHRHEAMNGERMCVTSPGFNNDATEFTDVRKSDPYAHLRECLANGGTVEIMDPHGSWVPMTPGTDFVWPADRYRISKPAPPQLNISTDVPFDKYCVSSEPAPSAQKTSCPGALVNEGCDLGLAGDPKVYVNGPPIDTQKTEEDSDAATIRALCDVQLFEFGSRIEHKARAILAKIKAGEIPGIHSEDELVKWKNLHAFDMRRMCEEAMLLREQLEKVQRNKITIENRGSAPLTVTLPAQETFTDGPSAQTVQNLQELLSIALDERDKLRALKTIAPFFRGEAVTVTTCQQWHDHIHELEVELNLLKAFHACFKPYAQQIVYGYNVDPSANCAGLPGYIADKWLAARKEDA